MIKKNTTKDTILLYFEDNEKVVILKPNEKIKIGKDEKFKLYKSTTATLDTMTRVAKQLDI